MAYDAMGNYTGFDAPLDPFEEERRREQMKAQMEAYAKQQDELASQVATKQEVTTYADGSQTRTIKQEMPAAPVAPTMDMTGYNQRIAQMESGAQPGIGYHQPGRSTAYGTYGITNAAYQDARRMNSNLPADITQATPEQQAAAQTAFTQANAGYLQSYGVPVNENTLSAAHFLGAKGLSDYLKTGYISPQAAAANGGEENVRRIVQQRLGGQAAPASAARQPVQQPVSPQQVQQQPAPQPQPAAQPQPQMAPNSFDEFGTPVFSQQQYELDNKLKQFEQIQNDPRALMNFEGPEWMQTNARLRAADIMAAEREQRMAGEKLQTATDTDLARYLRSKSDDNITNRIKAMLFSAAGNKEMAQRYMDRVDTVGTDKYVQGQDGKPYLLKVKANGEAIAGYSAETGKQLTPDQLVNVAAAAAPRKAAEMPSVHGAPVVNAQGEGGLRMYDPISQTSYVLVGKERRPDVGWTSQGQAPAAVFGAAAAGAAGKGAGEGFVPGQIPAFPGQQGAAPQGAAPAAAPSRAEQAAQALQQGAAPAAPAVPGVPQAPAAGTIAQQRQALEYQGQQQKEFVKHVAEDIQPKADAGSQIKRIRKEQMEGPDGILNNPELAGLLQGGGGEIGNIMRDLITGNFKDQADLSARVASLNLDDRQKAVLYRQIGLNLQVAPLTLKQNAGAGAVSDAEQKANREANVDITRQPLYSGLSLLTRDQFQKDLAVAKNDFRSSRPDIRTTDQLNAAWSAEKRKAEQAYDQIYAARAAYIAKHNPLDKNGNATNPGAVVDAFKLFPVPEWTGTGWDYKTEYARRAARPPLNNFVR